MDELVNATKNVQSEHPIINPENILLAGLYWSPVVDGILFKEQPARLLSDGNYDANKNVIAGIVENEAEVKTIGQFLMLRSIFMFFQFFIRALFKEPVGSVIYAATILVLFRDREITTEILSQYPPLCQQRREIEDRITCQQLLSEILSTGVARDQLNVLIDDACSWAVEYAPGDCIPNQDFDDRLTLEPLGTDFIFTCPMRYWLQNHGQG